MFVADMGPEEVREWGQALAADVRTLTGAARQQARWDLHDVQGRARELGVTF